MQKDILGVKINFGLTKDQVLEKIENLIDKKKGSHLIATTNPYFVMEAQKDEEFKKIINSATLSVPDGVGTLYANLYLNKAKTLKRNILFPIRAFVLGLYIGFYGYANRKELGERITGVELTQKLCELSSKKGYTIFFLGGRPRDNRGEGIKDASYSMSESARSVIKAQYPNVNIIGATSDFDRNEYDDSRTKDYIRAVMKEHNIKRLDILLVAYNPISQEKWISRNAKDIPCTISIGVGRTFDYIAGYMKTPNPLLDILHISWLYTLIMQPWRYKRVLMTFPVFPIKIYINLIKDWLNSSKKDK